ncbi:MAG: putative maltokinase, partial [Chloroflexi bacterium]|nr:putative maltokinase [Chloroflexota bacterium]
ALMVNDWGALPLDVPGVIALVEARYASGRPEQYVLPLIAARKEQPEGVRTPFALTLVHDGTQWYLHDAFQFTAFQRLLMEHLIAGRELALEQGGLIFKPESALRDSPPPLEQIRLVTAEQSNTSVIYDRQAILKCFRRVVAGLNPDVEVSRFLTTRAGFEHTPAMLGSIDYRSADDTAHSLGLLQGFVANEGDAWEHTLKLLGEFLAEARDLDPSDADRDTTTRRLAARQLDEIRQLGALTGELHLALSRDADDPDFAPRPLTIEQVQTWQSAIRDDAAMMLDDLQRRASDLPDEQQLAVRALLNDRSEIERRIDDLAPLAEAGVTITRYHGDYHLGQVLVSERGFLILDFEGEPLRSLAERRAHSSPLKDVAGMLRSFSYAAHAGLLAARDEQSGDAEAIEAQLGSWATAWEQCARESFLAGYTETTSGAAFVPKQPDLLRAALAVFELEKALYELRYELNNRPDWLLIPLRGIQHTLR